MLLGKAEHETRTHFDGLEAQGTTYIPDPQDAIATSDIFGLDVPIDLRSLHTKVVIPRSVLQPHRSVSLVFFIKRQDTNLHESNFPEQNPSTASLTGLVSTGGISTL